MPRLVGWRYTALIGGLVGGIALAIYPIIIDPMINTEKYKQIQAHTRANIKQEEIQPGNMKVWSDPFDRKKTNKTSSSD
ncbi:small integral membrane protein 20 [Aethina tumida]|uniref:small integral membrane protein 20 n=1 Tax=Aethina tumida TaxID=116153 RepID=UPI00214720FD|nr:small integral membrane protein 20 [Aethina tumida]